MALIAVLFALVVLLSAVNIVHTRLRWIEWDSRVRAHFGRVQRQRASGEPEMPSPGTVTLMVTSAPDSGGGEEVSAFAQAAVRRSSPRKRRRLRH